jgi:hypothetical protein
MAEVLTSFETTVRDAHGDYHARAVGRHADDGMWEAWIEFVPVDGKGEALISGVESRQPEREHLAYWATGLTLVYLEGALRRARVPVTVRVRTVETPISHAPAARDVRVALPSNARPHAILDPFAIAARNPDLLRQELGALDRPRLLNIIAAYDLNVRNADTTRMSDAELRESIVVATSPRQMHRAR